ncbi:MAG TPA: glutathione S-transferase family protein [Polyangiaceae bacterium]|jgi:glutathione S-transferase
MALPAPSHARLITIPFSHYCEKARWALDHAGVAYVEEAYLPGLHRRATRAVGGTSVPVLVTDEGRALVDSADIVQYCDERAPAERKLYPADPGARREVEAIEASCNADLGVDARLFVYQQTLSSPTSLVRATRPGLTRLQAALLPLAVPIVRPKIRAWYKVNEANAVRALETARRVFAEIGARLGKSRWLVGDRFTAADLTFASLGALVVAPPGHPALSCDIDRAGPLRPILEEMRATAAGAHLLRLYREERRSPGLRRV